MDTIGERLKYYIQSTGLSIKDFASIHKINISTLSKNISDNKIPGGDVLKKLISAGLNTNWLLVGVGKMQLVPHECYTTIPTPFDNSKNQYGTFSDSTIKTSRPLLVCGVTRNRNPKILLQPADTLIITPLDDATLLFNTNLVLDTSGTDPIVCPFIRLSAPPESTPYDFVEINTHKYCYLEMSSNLLNVDMNYLKTNCFSVLKSHRTYYYHTPERPY